MCLWFENKTKKLSVLEVTNSCKNKQFYRFICSIYLTWTVESFVPKCSLSMISLIRNICILRFTFNVNMKVVYKLSCLCLLLKLKYPFFCVFIIKVWTVMVNNSCNINNEQSILTFTHCTQNISRSNDVTFIYIPLILLIRERPFNNWRGVGDRVMVFF